MHEYCDAAEQLLVFAIEAACRPPAAAAAAAVASATAPLLNLRSFSTNYVKSPALLHALPTAALTQLQLRHCHAWRYGLGYDSSGIVSGLARLTRLHDLSLRGMPVSAACLAAVGGLPHLTKLRLQVDDAEILHLLPQQLKQLQLLAGLSSSSSSSSGCCLSLQHLTDLKDAELELYKQPAAGSALPASLTALTVSVSRHAGSSSVEPLGITALRQLQSLQFSGCCCEAADVLQLTELTSLTRLRLAYNSRSAAYAVAPVLRQVPLRSFAVFGSSSSDVPHPTAEDSTAMMQSLAAAAGLQRLVIHGSDVLHKNVGVCINLTGLQQLEHLSLCTGLHSRYDVMHLTALTCRFWISVIHWVLTMSLLLH
jgi:hypothetical protein